MLNTRIGAPIISGILAICITTYYYYYSSSYYLITTPAAQSITNLGMTTPGPQHAREPSVDDLHIFLSHTWQPVPTVKVTIQNTHPTSYMSFLSWDTPVDPSALNTGVLTIVYAVSGEPVPGPGLKLNRLLPPPREDIIELAPQETIEVDIDLSAPWIPGDGKLVKVHALGEWRAVWAKGKDEITNEELGAMSGPGVLRGPFRSVRDVEMEL